VGTANHLESELLPSANGNNSAMEFFGSQKSSTSMNYNTTFANRGDNSRISIILVSFNLPGTFIIPKLLDQIGTRKEDSNFAQVIF